MSVPILKHMYTPAYIVTDGEIILDIFSDEEYAKQYVELQRTLEDSKEKLQIVRTTVEILLGDDNEEA